MFLEEVLKKNIDNHLNLIDKKILLHISGGSDSIFLLYFMTHFYRNVVDKIFVLSVDFGFRKQAIDEVMYVEKCSKEWGVDECFIHSPFISLKNKKSIQSIARKKRLEKSEELRKKYNIDYVFLAHHRDDFLETMFLKMKRASSLGSLMQFSFQYQHYIRPLLDVTKKEILRYLYHRSIEYYDDQSNFEAVYDRNKLRLNVFPVLDEVFSNWRENFKQTFSDMEGHYLLLKKIIKKQNIYETIPDGIKLLDNYYTFDEKEQTIILNILFKDFFSFVLLKKLFLMYIREKIHNQKSFMIYKKKNKSLIFEKSMLYSYDFEHSLNTLRVGESVWINDVRVSLSLMKKDRYIMNGDHYYCFSSDKKIDHVVVKHNEKKDQIYFKQVGHKQVKKILSDHKLPIVMRKKSFVIECENDILFLFISPVKWCRSFKMDHQYFERSDVFNMDKKYQYFIKIDDY